MLRKDIKQVICSLVSELDFYFEERGFKRRKNGLIYVRKVGTTIQKIDMVFFSNPSYYQNVLAHIYPHMEILFPNVNSTAKIFASKLIPEKWLDKFTIRQPIQIYSNSEDFCLKDISNYECLKEEMLAFLKEYTMPLLEQLTCEKDYLTLWYSTMTIFKKKATDIQETKKLPMLSSQRRCPQMAGRKSDFTLPTLDELFTTQELRDDAKLSKIRDIPLELIDDFPGHPFKVRDDEDMIQLVESVKERGVITPATVRPKEDVRYELVSGNRRKRACELAGFDTLRCEVVDLDRDAATILMVESNFQRSQILPSEKAFAYKMRLEAMKRQAGRPSKENASPLATNKKEGF